MFLQTGLLVLSLGAIVYGAPRVVGGHDAPDHKYPFQVSLRTTRGTHLCGGSIINDRWILTAAHCVEDRPVELFILVAGTNFLDERGDTYWPQLTVIHEKYGPWTHYDISLTRTKTKIIFTEFVAPIGLPVEDLQDYSRPAVFSGWGSMGDKTGPYSTALQEIELNLVTMERCRENHNVTDAHICSLNKSGEGLCYGDSGGGLIVDNVLVGIASYVRPCALNRPDVFTRVWSYKNWIEETIDKNEKISI